jgi:hypothetical protein
MIAASYVDWNAMWKIVVIGLLGGAGLTAVYSIGLLALNSGGVTHPDDAQPTHRNILLIVVAVLCFLVVLGGVAYGIDTMLSK